MQRNRWLGAAAVLALTVFATPAIAQVCMGVPLGVGQTSLGLRADLPDGANIFGVRAANQFSDPLTLGASVRHFDPDGGDSRQSIGVDAAFGLPVQALEDAGAGLCAAAGVDVTIQDDPYRTISVPVGVAVGAGFEVDDGISVVPFAFPHLAWTRRSGDGGSVSDTNFGLEAGANLVVSNLFFGALISRVFEDFADTVFGVQAGIVF